MSNDQIRKLVSTFDYQPAPSDVEELCKRVRDAERHRCAREVTKLGRVGLDTNIIGARLLQPTKEEGEADV